MRQLVWTAAIVFWPWFLNEFKLLKLIRFWHTLGFFDDSFAAEGGNFRFILFVDIATCDDGQNSRANIICLLRCTQCNLIKMAGPLIPTWILRVIRFAISKSIYKVSTVPNMPYHKTVKTSAITAIAHAAFGARD